MLEGARNAGAGDLALRAPGDVSAEETDPALVERERTGNEVEHRGLAGAVGPDETQDLSGAELEAHVVDGDQPAEATRSAGNGQKRLAALGLMTTIEGARRERRGGLQARQVTQREGHQPGARALQQQD